MIAVREFSTLCLLFNADYLDTFEQIENKLAAKPQKMNISGNSDGMNSHDQQDFPKESKSKSKK
jgi:hypothetical protein